MTVSYRLGWLFFRSLFRVAFRLKVYHPERARAEGPFILAANHASFLDPLIIGAAMPRDIHYLARKTLFRFKPLGSLLRVWNVIPVDRDGGGGGKGLVHVAQEIKRGNPVLLFPEGSRSPDGTLGRARSGVGWIAAKSQAPVVPARVFGSFEAYNRTMKLPRLKPVAVKFGFPLHFHSQWRELSRCSKERAKEIYQEISDAAMEAIARLEPCRDKDRFP